MNRHPRAAAQRSALGRKLRAHRMALGWTVRGVRDHVGTGKPQMQAVETADHDVMLGTLVDIAAVYGLNVALAGDHHLPLLELSAAEVVTLLAAACDADARLPAGELRDRAAAALAELGAAPPADFVDE